MEFVRLNIIDYLIMNIFLTINHQVLQQIELLYHENDRLINVQYEYFLMLMHQMMIEVHRIEELVQMEEEFHSIG